MSNLDRGTGQRPQPSHPQAHAIGRPGRGSGLAPAPADTALRFAGYAALFDRRDAGRDIIRRGAFTKSLAQRRAQAAGPLPLYWQHRPEVRIGWVDEAHEDAHGLAVTARIDNAAGGAAAALKSGRVTGLSFGYRARRFAPVPSGGRELNEIDILEVSLVTHPMQHAARVERIHLPAPG